MFRVDRECEAGEIPPQNVGDFARVSQIVRLWGAEVVMHDKRCSPVKFKPSAPEMSQPGVCQETQVPVGKRRLRLVVVWDLLNVCLVPVPPNEKTSEKLRTYPSRELLSVTSTSQFFLRMLLI